MRATFVTAAAVATLVIGSSIAGAQVVIDLTPEVRTEFREYVVRERVAPVEVTEEIGVGVALPGHVTLSGLPPFIIERYPDYRDYRYVVVNEHIYIVQPDTREVVTIID